MAANTKARFSLSMYDNNGNRGTFLAHAYIDNTGLISDLTAALATLATAVATVSTGGVKEATVSIVDTAVASAPAADANLPSGAVFDFLKAGAPNRYGLFIPSWLDSLTGTGGHIDVTAGVPAAFATSMLAAVVGGKFANNDYEAYNAIDSAFLSDRGRRRRVR